jgi:hypothetical protein
MSESALASSIAALENSWSSLDGWVKLWITLVVMGVVVELATVLTEYRSERKEYLRASILLPHPPKKPNGWRFFWEFLGAGLVAIGVSGELGAHFIGSKLETELRNKNHELVTSIQHRAANAELETARLYALTAPRRLTPEQQRDMVNVLRPFRGRRIVVVSHAYDPEGYLFAKQVVGVFKRAELVVEERPVGRGSVSGMGSFNTETGVVVGWPLGQRDFAVKVHDALDKIGHVRELSLVPMQGPDEAQVTVNWKPLDLP